MIEQLENLVRTGGLKAEPPEQSALVVEWFVFFVFF